MAESDVSPMQYDLRGANELHVPASPIVRLIVVTNNYPSEGRNESSIVKAFVEKYRQLFPLDELKLILLKKNEGWIGYGKKWASLISEANHKYKLVIHFGGTYAFMASLIGWLKGAKVVVVFHGTDIHGSVPKGSSSLKYLKIKANQLFSFLTIPLTVRSEFVSETMIMHVPGILRRKYANRLHLHQLSVDYDLFRPMGKESARAELGLFPSCRYFLFFNNNKSNIKRPDIARHIMERLGDGHSLLEVTNVPFQQLPIYYAASDFLLVTSDNEGSPNVVREALAMNLPVISRNVGDVASYISPFSSCLVIPENPEQAANLIREHLASGANTANELLRESLFERLDLDTNTRKCRNILATMK